MLKFKVKYSECTDLDVTLDKHSVNIRSQDGFDLGEALGLVDKALANELRVQFPKDYAFIIDDEDYGLFLHLGSPQMMECGWNVDYHTESYLTSLTITGIDL